MFSSKRARFTNRVRMLIEFDERSIFLRLWNGWCPAGNRGGLRIEALLRRAIAGIPRRMIVEKGRLYSAHCGDWVLLSRQKECMRNARRPIKDPRS
jgi:hypothetical protein